MSNEWQGAVRNRNPHPRPPRRGQKINVGAIHDDLGGKSGDYVFYCLYSPSFNNISG